MSLASLFPLWLFLHPRSTLHIHYALTVHKSIMELIRYCFLDQKYTLFHHEWKTREKFHFKNYILKFEEQRAWDWRNFCSNAIIHKVFLYYLNLSIKMQSELYLLMRKLVFEHIIMESEIFSNVLIYFRLCCHELFIYHSD